MLVVFSSRSMDATPFYAHLMERKHRILSRLRPWVKYSSFSTPSLFNLLHTNTPYTYLASHSFCRAVDSAISNAIKEMKHTLYPFFFQIIKTANINFACARKNVILKFILCGSPPININHLIFSQGEIQNDFFYNLI